MLKRNDAAKVMGNVFTILSKRKLLIRMLLIFAFCSALPACETHTSNTIFWKNNKDIERKEEYKKENLLDGVEIKDGCYIDAGSGKTIELDGYSTTDYFNVSSGLSYDLPYYSSGSQIAFYDKKHNYITGFVTNERFLTIPSNEHITYARWCGETAFKSSWEINITEDVYYVNTRTGLLEGMIAAYKNKADQVVVLPGEYDIIAEYEAHFGSNYFEDYAADYNNEINGIYDCGIPIDNIDIRFESGTRVIANYRGNNQNVKEYFSAFAVAQNAVINGLVLDASELRYGLHVDYHRDAVETLEIKNCDLHHYKQSDSGIKNNQAIGAGLAINSSWTIENCIFRSDTDHPVIYIHNNLADDAISRVNIIDCYVVGRGYFLLNSYSTSNKQTTAFVTGCSWVTPAMVGRETPDSMDNITLYAWNNETRSE